VQVIGGGFQPGYTGHDQQGNPIKGKTWVNSEFAPGIPKKRAVEPVRSVTKPGTWRLVVQQHPAARAGDHLDLRVVDPETGYAHSWVTRKNLPEPGGQALRVFQQPTHTREYATEFEGEIGEGYGKTREGEKVRKVIDELVEVLQADPDFMRFNMYTGRGPQEFVLTRDKKHAREYGSPPWYLINVTQTRDKLPKELPFSKPKYRELEVGAVDLDDPKQVMMAKIDGGHVTTVLKRGRRPRVFSYREPKERKTGAIEHSQKVESLYHSKVPAELDNTILRGELYARDPDGRRSLPAETVSGMLNAGVWKSRQLQEEKGKLRSAIFDVVQFRGRDMTNAGYDEKLEALRAVQKAMPQFEIPALAFTKEEKAALLDAIEKKLHPQTGEGVVLWHRTRAKNPVKAKFKIDRDVFVRDVLEGKGKHRGRAGAFTYSRTPDGPVVGKVGGGFSDALREDMWKRKDAYRGAVAKVLGEKETASKAIAKPRFTGWHLDKNDETFWEAEPVTK